MDNKLSELSKPVFEIEVSGGYWLNCSSGQLTPDAATDFTDWPDGVNRLYSQEYVYALLAELEAKDDALRAIAFHVSAGGYNADSVDSEVFKQKIIYGINSISDVQIKRIAELEAIRADASLVFKEIGSELGCNPDNESIMMAIDELKKRLATPVRLPDKTSDLDSWDGGWDACLEECGEAVRAAGFTVEGDE